MKAIQIAAGAVLATVLLVVRDAPARKKRRKQRREAFLDRQLELYLGDTLKPLHGGGKSADEMKADVFGPQDRVYLMGQTPSAFRGADLKDASGPVRPQDVRAEVVDGSTPLGSNGAESVATVTDSS